MRASFLRWIPLFTGAALLAACAGNSAGGLVQPPLRAAAAHDRVQITCGTDRDDCNAVRLVAPLDVRISLRGAISLSLDNPQCAHAHVRIGEDGALPLSPVTYTSRRSGPLLVLVSAMTDPCKHDDREADLRAPMIVVTPTPAPTTVTGNTGYYVVALVQNTDGTYTLTTVDGPAHSDGTTLTWTSPVLEHSVRGSYAFYLAASSTERDSGEGDDNE